MIPSIDRRTGKRRRDDAIDLHGRHAAWTVRRLQRALIAACLASPDHSATIEAARAVVAIPVGVSPTVAGAACRGLVRDRVIAAAGYVDATRPQAHARPIRRWRLVNRAAAVVWLETNPDPEQTPAERDGRQYLLPLAGD